MYPKQVKDGQYIIREGEAGQHLYVAAGNECPGGGALGQEKYGCVRPDPQTSYPLPFALL